MQGLQAAGHSVGIPLSPQRGQPVHLSLLHLRTDLQDRDLTRLRLHVVVDADDDPLFPFHLTQVPLRGLQDLPLREPSFDRLHHPTHLIQLPEVIPRTFFQSVGQRLDIVGPAERVHRVRHLAFLRDDLLSAQGQLDRLFRRKRQGFVHRVGVQRLSSAQHRRKRLKGRADHVIHWLLRHQGTAGRLRMAPELERARVFRMVSSLHLARPQSPSGPEFGDFLEQVIVHVEEEGKLRREGIHGQPGLDC